MEAKTTEVKIGYFPNEKGDFTITIHNEPVAFTFDRQSAVKLVNSYKSLLLRVDVLSKMEEHSTQQNSELKEELEDIRQYSNKQAEIISALQEELEAVKSSFQSWKDCYKDNVRNITEDRDRLSVELSGLQEELEITKKELLFERHSIQLMYALKEENKRLRKLLQECYMAIPCGGVYHDLNVRINRAIHPSHNTEEK